MIVPDTNVLSEMMRPSPPQHLQDWLDGHAPGTLWTTSATEAEILHGIAILPEGRRQATLAEGARLMFEEDMAGRVLPFDRAAARAYAELAALSRSNGRPMAVADGQIAASAWSRGAVPATRNVRDFEACGIGLIDPRAQP